LSQAKNNSIAMKKICDVQKKSALLSFILYAFLWLPSQGQTGAGSMSIYNGFTHNLTTDSTFEYAESIYIGPNAQLEINGVFIIHSKNVWIAPAAQITGNGKIIFTDPGNNLFYQAMTGAPTLLDANNGTVWDIDIEFKNPQNIVLADVADPGYGVPNPAGTMAATLNIGKDISFQADDGYLSLNGHNLVLGHNASISNYASNRMILTGNSATGHVVKQNNSPTSFIFPIGIAENDYTPAVIHGDGTYHVSVTDYNACGATIHIPEEGIDRSWHIYGSPALSISLHHNVVTNGSEYFDPEGFITQYMGSGTWSSAENNDYISAGIHSNSVAMAARIAALSTDDGAWLSKTSDASTPLPVTLIKFEVVYSENKEAILHWVTNLQTDLAGFEIEHSTNGTSWNKIGMVKTLSSEDNNNLLPEYIFYDPSPAIGQNYYRLKLIDVNNTAEYSPAKKLLMDEENETPFVYPNPLGAQLYIGNIKDRTRIHLYSSTGRIIHTSEIEQNTPLNLEHLAPGTYFLHIHTSSGKIFTEKIIK
jgi:hypothetical protein